MFENIDLNSAPIVISLAVIFLLVLGKIFDFIKDQNNRKKSNSNESVITNEEVALLINDFKECINTTKNVLERHSDKIESLNKDLQDHHQWNRGFAKDMYEKFNAIQNNSGERSKQLEHIEKGLGENREAIVQNNGILLNLKGIIESK